MTILRPLVSWQDARNTVGPVFSELSIMSQQDLSTYNIFKLKYKNNLYTVLMTEKYKVIWNDISSGLK